MKAYGCLDRGGGMKAAQYVFGQLCPWRFSLPIVIDQPPPLTPPHLPSTSYLLISESSHRLPAVSSITHHLNRRSLPLPARGT